MRQHLSAILRAAYLLHPMFTSEFRTIYAEALRLHLSSAMTSLRTFIKRRFKRMRRRRKVGRAYDMALEVARVLPQQADVLDVGCGNGFIAHHLTGLLGKPVVGLDVGDSTAARINYLPYDGRHFPCARSKFRRRVALLRAASRAGRAPRAQ